ncbi:Ig-like domain-containing protein [uncultured Methanobrevibacter sp.]|uniref:Ig-like domain-containing protein n=1 Tax=uncultured Methanobrevibacter sp. TaxID=253161 RepID=UPI0026299940|nr:hypothetical protein [uncultured Methanobrevibacter sp.]
MKLKTFSIAILLFLTLIISIGAIAADDIADVNDAPSNTSTASTNTSTTTDSPKTTTSTTVKKVDTKVSADQVANEYKKSRYFKVKVKDKNGHVVKNIKIKLKIYTGSKYKSYTVNTNSKGIAKFNTKSLKLGNHKVVISSADSKYKISKTSKIFIGKKHYAIVKPKVKKVLKNKDVLGVKIYNDEDEKEAKVVYKKTPKYTKVVKAVFYLKNKKTGKLITKTDSAEFDDGRWELPEEDFSKKYTLVKVKVWYLSSK